MEITFKGRQTDVATRFRDQATAKLLKLEKLDQKAIRVDVEVSVERNPRQSSQKERVELTIISRGPTIRAEAAAEDRFAAFDLALAKLDSRLRRALDRRKRHHAGQRSGDSQVTGQPAAPSPPAAPASAPASAPTSAPAVDADPAGSRSADLGRSVPRQTISRPGKSGSPGGQDPVPSDSVVPIEMEGDGPLVVRQKFHHAAPIPIDQALLEMELVGHDFYLFHDIDEDVPSVVYRRRGYQYGVIRLVENRSAAVPASRGPARSEVAAGDLAGQPAAMPSARP